MWRSVLERFSVRQLLALLGDVAVAAAILVPWIYGFSPPIGPSHQISQIAAPNLLDLALHSDYGYLIIVPLCLLPGLAFVGLFKRRRSLELVAIVAAFVLSFVPTFEFGLQFGSAIGLIYNGSYVSFSLTLGPGSRIMEVGTALYFICMFVVLISDD